MAKKKPKGKSTKLQADVQDKNNTRSDVQPTVLQKFHVFWAVMPSQLTVTNILKELNAFISCAMQPREEQAYNIGVLIVE